MAPPDGEALAGPTATVQAAQLALSPDGQQLAFVASSAGSPSSLWVRDLDDTTPRLLPGTDDASYPFWSPDGRTVGFFANAQLKRVDVQGGTPQVLCEAPEPRGGTWNRDGDIVFAFSNSSSLRRIAAAGGTPTAITQLDTGRGEVSHRFPQFLPDGRHVLYRVRSTVEERSGVYVTTLGSSDARQLLDSRWSASYAPPGYLLFLTGGTLMAQRFDADALQLSGEPSPVAEGVGGSTTDNGAFSVSETGVLAFGGDTSVPTRLTWFSRTGTRLEPLVPPGTYVTARLSPDQTKLAFSRVDEQTNTPDVWSTRSRAWHVFSIHHRYRPGYSRGLVARQPAGGVPFVSVWHWRTLREDIERWAERAVDSSARVRQDPERLVA